MELSPRKYYYFRIIESNTDSGGQEYLLTPDAMMKIKIKRLAPLSDMVPFIQAGWPFLKRSQVASMFKRGKGKVQNPRGYGYYTFKVGKDIRGFELSLTIGCQRFEGEMFNALRNWAKGL